MKTPILDEFIEELQELKDDNFFLTKDLEERLIEFKNIKAAINYTHSCESDSELLPSFLYKHEGGLYFKHLEDTDITEQWNEYLKTR